MRIMMDCDTGIDDALAILYLLGSPDAELIGVTGVFGNVQESVAVLNSRGLLDCLGRPDIPVYEGAGEPSYWQSGPGTAGKPYTIDPGCERFHGKNGFGGAQLPGLPSSYSRGSIYADGAAAIAEAVRRYGTSVTILATGPLTDIDEALRRAPDIAPKMKLVMMGGTLTQPGNCYDLVCETNIINDRA